jgi:hypothetical protein
VPLHEADHVAGRIGPLVRALRSGDHAARARSEARARVVSRRNRARAPQPLAVELAALRSPAKKSRKRETTSERRRRLAREALEADS